MSSLLEELEPLARKLITSSLLLLTATVVSQSTFNECKSANLTSNKDADTLITAINKSEVRLAETHSPSAFTLARFFALSHRALDNQSQNILLSTLGVTHLNEQAASILFRNHNGDGLFIKEATWHPAAKDTWGPQLNAWLKTNTHGMAGDLKTTQKDFENKSGYHCKIDEVLATSFYANLKWTKPFLTTETQSENFFTEPSWSEFFPPGKAQIMHSHGTFDFFSDAEIRAVKLPCWQGSSTSPFEVVLVVPNKGPGTLHDLQASLSNWDVSKWQKWLQSFHPVALDLALPKFHCVDSMRQGNTKSSQWISDLQRIIPTSGRCSIIDVIATHNAILDERGFRFGEADEYYLTRDQRLRISVSPSSQFQDHSNNPPGVTYFSYHPKSGMIINQPFMVLLFDKKSQALLYATLWNG